MSKQFIYVVTAAIIGILFSCAFRAGNSNKEERPNILLIVSEDHGQHFSAYGDTIIKTPYLDQLAKSGFLFKNAYVTESVCSPSRSSILTGLYPHQNGQLGLTTHGFHMVGEIKSVYALLKDAGYRTGMIGKLHIRPDSVFPIGYYPMREPNYNKNSLERYARYAGEFFSVSDEPFFLMINYPDAHWPFLHSVEGRPAKPVSAEEVAPFPYIGFDNKRIREYTAGIYNGILRLDECIGELTARLRESGKEENTLIIYLSDHGDEMARGKFDIYEASNKVPFIVNWPAKIKKGVKSDALISSVDIVPTILDAAGLPRAKNLPGKSMLSHFENTGSNFRQYLFTEKNCDQIGMYFPRRSVRDEKFKLIYSLLSDRENEVALAYTKNSAKPRKDAVAGSPTLEELKSAPKNIQKLYQDWIKPPQIQLYDLENDPWELNDLSSSPEFAAVKQRLLKALFDWQQETNDPLRFPQKLKQLTAENDTIRISRNMRWQYPNYLYGINER